MALFALVHGAWHGAWCWSAVIPQLEALGHETLAVDLPCDEVDVGAMGYAEIVRDAIGENKSDVVLVGHSLAGLTIPIVAELRAVSCLIFVCAMFPTPGKGIVTEDAFATTLVDRHFRLESDGRLSWCDELAATSLMYGDCSAEIASHAYSRLRPQALTPMTERSPLRAWPRTRRVAIGCRQDAVLDLATARVDAREKVGSELIELDGSHSPFLSRPTELARQLDSLLSQ